MKLDWKPTGMLQQAEFGDVIFQAVKYDIYGVAQGWLLARYPKDSLKADKSDFFPSIEAAKAAAEKWGTKP